MKARYGVLSIVGAGVGQSLLFLSTILVTRNVDADSIGQYGILFQMVTLALVCGALRLEQAILFAESDRDARSIASAALSIVIPMSILAAVLSSLFFSRSSLTSSDYVALSISLLLSVTFGSASRVLIALAIRSGHGPAAAVSSLVRPTALSVTLALAAYIAPNSTGSLPMALAGGQLLLLLASGLMVRDFLATYKFSSPTEVLLTLRRNFDFVRYGLVQNFAFIASESIMPLYLVLKFPAGNAVALFWLASRIVFAPATIVVESVRSLVYRRIAGAANIFHEMKRVFLLFVPPFLLGAAVIAAFGGMIFSVIFGDQWAGAAEYATILSLLVALNVASLAVAASAPVLRAQRSYLLVEVAGIGVRALTLFGYEWETPIFGLAACTIAYSLLMLCYFLVVFRMAKKRREPTVAPTAQE